MGTQQSAISRLESGKYNPSVDFLFRIAKALNRKVEINFA
ncbi:MAG: helix-turn-helix transcriptional regulator [Candidatus Aminicenantes bacterium]|nr:helix-turn-helix transcriptional regulator [Candidatus Aminicenantes bacterium]